MVSYAQDYSWWNEKHNWDGYTHWTSYLIFSPKYMGPNALPVPEVRKGNLSENRSLELSVDGHFSRGDQTANLFTRLFLPLFSDRIGLEISYIPFEVYRTDTLTRDLRRSREYDPRGIQSGDVYFSTLIHLVKEQDRVPDLMISINIKTASGTGIDGARHTDSPGYFFDASAGKNIYIGEGTLKYLRVYAMLGFYVYQTNLDNHRQNDAFQYGAGCDLNFGKLQMDHQLGGYLGYLDNGDHPMVYRMNLSYTLNPRFDLICRFQQGFFDYPYSSIRAGTVINF